MAPRIVLLAALLAFGVSGPGALADDRLRGEAARVDLKAGGAGDGKGPALGVTCCTRCPNHAWCSPQTWQCYNAKVKTYYFPCR
mmetsp:Transcript_135308/g.432047  ORF Transcript_135308/g.432047 Transcript_135308/m.432047 type:complete len:84 (-) Transcript_135308:126-377(-)